MCVYYAPSVVVSYVQFTVTSLGASLNEHASTSLAVAQLRIAVMGLALMHDCIVRPVLTRCHLVLKQPVH